MEKVYVMDNRGHETEAFKIRYFNYENANYFIYTLGEIDKDEYVKLYLKKLKNGEEQFISEDDWLKIKSIIQKVVKEIKSGKIVSFRDLNMSSINEIMETDTRIFKLKKSIVEEIIYEEPRVEIKEEIVEPTPTKNKEDVDPFIENIEDSIKNSFGNDFNLPKKENTKIKPITVGNVVNTNEYREKNISLSKELEEYKVITYKLKEENNILKKKLIEYREKLETIQSIMKDI
jgi:FtsZ-binding cell division protein ZapB